MRTRMLLVTIPLFAMWAPARADAPITSNPIPEPIVKHGLAVEIKDLVRLPDTRGLRPAGSGRFARRLGACELRARSPRWTPLCKRLAGLSVSDRRQQSNTRLCGCGRGVSVWGLQPPRERLHRLRLSSRIRDQRPVLHGAQRDWSGKSENTRLHSVWIRPERRHLPQRHYGVARDEPGGQHVRGHAA